MCVYIYMWIILKYLNSRHHNRAEESYTNEQSSKGWLIIKSLPSKIQWTLTKKKIFINKR